MNILLLNLKFFSFFVLIILGLIVIGNAILILLPIKEIKEKKYTSILYYLITGTTSVVLFYSIINTNFKTVNVLFFLFMVLAIKKYFDKNKSYKIDYAN